MTLTLEGVGYHYPATDEPSLAGVTFGLGPGEVVGVVGANEAGKSTLCLVAAGRAPVIVGGRLAGTVLVDGDRSTDLRPHELAQRCGLLGQDPWSQLSGTARTVFEEVAFGPCNLGLPLAEVVERVGWALAVLGIAHLAHRHPERLSGGQAQLVTLASVLALRPPHLVLDEPTSQLDPLGTRLVADALLALRRETGTSLLVAEHKTDLLQRLAARVLVLSEGEIVADGPADAVLSDPALERYAVDRPARWRVGRAIERHGLQVDRALLDEVALVDEVAHAGAGTDPAYERGELGERASS